MDDLVIYRMAPDHFFLCVNASNQEKDFEWIRENAFSNTEIIFSSDEFSQLSIQGPRALEILQPLTDIRLAAMKYYWFNRGLFAGVDAIVSRTGYTGEDGFEVYCSPAKTETVWTQIMEAGKPFGLAPIGLAARNTLRLEANLLLYGNDMDETTSVLEANLGWICKFQKITIPGWTMEGKPSGSTLKQGQVMLSETRVSFKAGDQTLEIIIMDFLGKTIPFLTGQQLQMESTEETIRTTEVQGFKGLETFRHQDKQGELNISVADRFWVKIDGEGIDNPEVLKKSLNRWI